MELREIDAKTHMLFMTGHKKEHYMQTDVWGEVKSDNGWSHEFAGMYDGDRLVASLMLLKKKLPALPRYLYYAPRGPVADFDDREQIRALTQLLRGYLKERRGIYLAIDPDVPYRVCDSREHEQKPKDDLVEFMQSIGWRHQGFPMNFEGRQPRFTFRLRLDGGAQAVFDGFDRMAKKNIGISEESCIQVEARDDLTGFFELMEDTARRDNFYEGSRAYYERLYPMLRDAGMAELTYARYQPKLHYAQIDGQISAIDAEIAGNEKRMLEKNMPKLATRNKQLMQKRDRIEKQRQTAEQYMQTHPDGLDLSALICIHTKNRFWTVYGGNSSELRQTSANYAITWQAIRKAADDGMEFVDFFGSTGDPSPDNPVTGIYAFKKKFSGDFVEFPGEFHLVVRPGLYAVWEKFSPAVLRVMRKIKRKLHR